MLVVILFVKCYVFMCGLSLLVWFVVDDVCVLLLELVDICVLIGGMVVWIDVGLLLESGEICFVLLCVDCYWCLYEGIDNVVVVM